MEAREKLRLLKALPLFARLPSSKLAALSKFLDPLDFRDGAMIFEEGSAGDSLFLVSSGHIRIQKSAAPAGARSAFKDLAILGPGDCLGEMALFDEKTPRSARATAEGDAVLFRLGRQELRRWLDANPALAGGFFTELVQTLTKRLRRSSNELTLLFDLSQRLLEPVASGKELLQQALRHLLPHLEGAWSAGAYLYNEFNAEMELAAAEGDFGPAARELEKHPLRETKNAWIDERRYAICLPGRERPRGYLVFQRASAPSGEEKNETARTLTTAGRLIASALENVEHRAEETLRARLATSRQYAPGF